MNIDISLETAVIFYLANLYLKQGIGLVYVMVDFICMRLLDLWGAQIENYKMKNSSAECDSNPVPSAFEENLLSIVLLDQIYIEDSKVYRALPEFAIYIDLYHVVDVAKLFLVYFCHMVFVSFCC